MVPFSDARGYDAEMFPEVVLAVVIVATSFARLTAILGVRIVAAS